MPCRLGDYCSSIHCKVTFCVVKLDDVTTRNVFVAAAKKRSSQKLFGLASFVVDFILLFRLFIIFCHMLLSHPRIVEISFVIPWPQWTTQRSSTVGFGVWIPAIILSRDNQLWKVWQSLEACTNCKQILSSEYNLSKDIFLVRMCLYSWTSQLHL